MSRSDSLDIFAVTAPGLEPLCWQELASIGIRGRVVEGGVAWSGDMEAVERANLWLRTASRIVVRIAEFKATAFFELELRAKSIEWERWVAPKSSVEFRVTCRKSKLYHSDAVAQRFGEAVAKRVKGVQLVDANQESDDAPEPRSPLVADAPRGRRLATEPALRSASDVGLGMTKGALGMTKGGMTQRFIVRFLHDVCTVSVDTSGELLHLRGYRQALAKAPLRETLAAAVLLGVSVRYLREGSGWMWDSPLVDPMCGSGTIPIEAARIARRIAPGRDRDFAFLHWPTADKEGWKALLDEARAVELPSSPIAIAGSDRDEGAIVAAKANAERAGVAADIEFEVKPISALSAAEPPGLIVSNPPYGVRVGETDRLRNLYAQLGNVVRAKRPGWTLALLTADRNLERQLHLDLEEQFRTKNGGIPVRLVTAEVTPREVSPRG